MSLGASMSSSPIPPVSPIPPPGRWLPIVLAIAAIIGCVAVFLPWHQVAPPGAPPPADCASTGAGCAVADPIAAIYTDTGFDHAGPTGAIGFGVIALAAIVASVRADRATWRVVAIVVGLAEIPTGAVVLFGGFVSHLDERVTMRFGTELYLACWFAGLLGALVLVASSVRIGWSEPAIADA